jgi:hypothetical protein
LDVEKQVVIEMRIDGTIAVCSRRSSCRRGIVPYNHTISTQQRNCEERRGKRRMSLNGYYLRHTTPADSPNLNL